jgi:NTP pyrophosphatase (non-canonical NTP hydrolase)
MLKRGSFEMNINELVQKAHENAVSKGFYECVRCEGSGEVGSFVCNTCNGSGKTSKNIGELLMLIVSEIGEALEAHRKNRTPMWEFYYEMIDSGKSFEESFKENIKDCFEDEIADAVIRIFDMCGYLGIDLEKHIELKMKYNATRERKHGKSY